MELRLELDDASPVAGAGVRSRQMVPLGVKVEATARRDEIVRLADFSPAGSPAFLSASELADMPPEQFLLFPGLALGKPSAGPLDLKPLAPGWKGVEVPFEPKRPGVYLLRATWELAGGGTLTGPPVVLTVRPKPAPPK